MLPLPFLYSLIRVKSPFTPPLILHFLTASASTGCFCIPLGLLSLMPGFYAAVPIQHRPHPVPATTLYGTVLIPTIPCSQLIASPYPALVRAMSTSLFSKSPSLQRQWCLTILPSRGFGLLLSGVETRDLYSLVLSACTSK